MWCNVPVIRRGEAGRTSWLKRLKGLASGLIHVWAANGRIFNTTCLIWEIALSQERKMRHQHQWAQVPVTQVQVHASAPATSS